ncbi:MULTISPECIES: signal peptidase I [Thalassotalea]|uniref:Signal peptidase I n=1 Tax=Thalassotalea castellviae TaxID=3075612 RepID=A0ABU2ZWW6_9GAMM|nr:signal peptidase I [Thalassotalea sp. W431]MDT0602424.1 signal peptidase I [Thalassotalea sp. W431]
MKNMVSKIWIENKSLIVFITLMLIFRSAVADWNDVPTGSMKPTIVEGDRILINKLAYDINIPFTQQSLIKLADPQVNDIIIFESKAANKRLVKRVIGVPGDIVAMSNNKLTINHQKIAYTGKQINSDKVILDEEINQNPHRIQITNNPSPLRSFNSVKVPKDHYLVLGDNRNNSADSRVIGFVPRSEIIGRSSKVVLSLDYNNYFLPRKARFLLDI